MAMGKFRLQYQNADAVHACEGVKYRLVNQETGHYFSLGSTNASGETKPVAAEQAGGRCYLEVFDDRTGQHVAPDLHGTQGSAACPELALAGVDDTSSTVKTVRVKPYFRVRFHTQVGNR